MDLGRQVLKHKRHGLMDRLVRNHLIGIQNQDQIGGDVGCKIIDQAGQQGFLHRLVTCVELHGCCFTKLRIDLLQSRDEIPEEPFWIVVRWFQREPGNASRT